MGYGFYDSFGMGFGFFDIFSILFSLVFFLVIGVFIFVLVKGIGQWNKNNNSPRLTVDAAIVAKRQHTSHHHHGTDMHMHHHSSSYYVTFQVESGDRMELHVPGNQYGLLIEGDRGKLTFQGTRFLSFQRM
jgi:uncharacterized membrane protein